MKLGVLLVLLVAAVAAVSLSFAELWAAPEDVQVGDVRAMVARDGTVLRARPSVLGRSQSTLGHGAQVRIEEVRGAWIRVTSVAGGGPAGSGGVRKSRTVEPFALTQGGQQGWRGGARQARGPTQTEISAAGRQFDSATEKGYRASSAALGRAYPQVDRIEKATPAAAAIERFILEGRLGRPEACR